MQSSIQVVRNKSTKRRWDDGSDNWEPKGKRSNHQVRRSIDDYFERKRYREMFEDY